MPESQNKSGNKGATGPGKGSQTRNQRKNPYVPVTKPEDVVWAPGGQAGKPSSRNDKTKGSPGPNKGADALRRAAFARLQRQRNLR